MPTARQYFIAGVSGAKELGQLFDELPKSLSDSVLRETGKKALQPVADEAKTLIARQSLGATAKVLNSIQISTVLKASQKAGEKRKPGDVVVYVGASSPKGNVAHLVEFGTGPRYHKDGSYAGIMPAEPFMRPAWDTNKDKVLQIYRDEIWNVLKKAVRRLRGRAERGTISKTQSRFFGGW
jgi:HK97 gp10 family phage protein